MTLPIEQTNHSTIQNRQILLIDDNESIIKDFRKILELDDWSDLEKLSGELFDESPKPGPDKYENGEVQKNTVYKSRSNKHGVIFHIDSALKGEDGYQMTLERVKTGNPYALAFVDMRMPLGWDGLETIHNLWSADPDMQIVICTAYSDYTWQELMHELERPDQVLLLKKPFEPIEICQLALSLTEKWNLARIARLRMKEMEKLVEEKTKEVVTANQHKTRFLNMLGHEFFTPLNGVLGFTQIIKTDFSDTLSNQLLTYIDFIEISGERLNALITDLLDVVNSASGRLSIVPQPVSPAKLIDHALKNFARLSESHIVQVHLNDVTQPVYADINRCNQILLNLLMNAQKHATGSAPIQLVLSETDDQSMRIEVQDRGPGIDKEKLEKIFTLFHNIEASDLTSTEGFGLGLALAKQLVEMQGGELNIKSVINEGTTVWFTLPLVESLDHDITIQP